MINYSEHIKNLEKEEQLKIDLVLIDGRFRVACCLKCYNVISNDCLIIFDDFLKRPQYNIVLNYFDIIEKTKDNNMVLLKKKDNMVIPQELIEKYELIRD
jgi:hypothetical protein